MQTILEVLRVNIVHSCEKVNQFFTWWRNRIMRGGQRDADAKGKDTGV